MAKYSWSRAEHQPPPPRRGLTGYIERHLPGVSIGIMVTLLIGFVLYPYMLVTVPSGDVGVLWKRFTGPGIYCWCILGRGTVLDPQELRDEGLHVIWPWDMLYLYDLRLQSETEKYNAISSDGVSVTAEINIRFQLLHNSVAVFHKFIGPGYLVSLIVPEIGAEAREVISHYTAEKVYTSRFEIEDEIRAQAQKSLGTHLNQLFQAEASEQQDRQAYQLALQNAIRIIDTLVLSIELPPDIVTAINRQTEQFYSIQEYRNRVLREAEESKRKQIEADGIAAFQRTVSQGISDSYLRWRGIEATLALAQSQNSKIVIIGGGKEGLPIILGNIDAPAPPSQNQNGGNTSPTDKTKPQNPTTDKPIAATGREPSSSIDLSDFEAILSKMTDALTNKK